MTYGDDRRIHADLQRARDEIRRPQCTAAAVKDGRVVASDRGDGVAPLLRVMQGIECSDAGVVVADRIVGMAAALFLHPPLVIGVYGDVMSLPAREHLEAAGMKVWAGREVSAILNRLGDDLCPMEKMATENDPETARKHIRNLVQQSNRSDQSDEMEEE